MVGKKVAQDLYIHRNYMNKLNKVMQEYIEVIRDLEVFNEEWTLIKVNLSKKHISLLKYPDFDLNGHPELETSISINFTTKPPKIKYRKGGGKILHRKELFVDIDYPQYDKFVQLTKEEEKRGLLDKNIIFQGKKLGPRMGNKKIWKEWLKYKHVKIENHKVISDVRVNER